MLDARLQLPGTIASTDIKVQSPRLSKQPDPIRVELEGIQINGVTIAVILFPKNSNWAPRQRLSAFTDFGPCLVQCSESFGFSYARYN